MYKLKYLFITLLLIAVVLPSSARNNPNEKKTKTANSENQEQATLRDPCAPGSSQISQAINNVRARLLINGDIWWDGSGDPKYIVPKVEAGLPEVSSIFAGAVWIGGRDSGENLKLAAKTYGTSTGVTDFWPGPIDENTLDTESNVCENWDKHFTVLGEDIRLHLSNWSEAQLSGGTYDSNLIPRSIKGWPARKNEFFFEIHGFTLPTTTQGLAGFFDRNFDRVYDPIDGDYPVIEVRGCDPEDAPFPDEMIFWIYNDVGNVHTETDGDPMQMEVQVQSFAYETNDQINDMTFQRYKLINRGQEDLFDTYFAMWVDPDLGCDFDDYVGCDTTRSLAYIYNSDAVDGTVEGDCTCASGAQTYCRDIPVLGIDYFRGPLDEFAEEIGMSSFTYYNRSSSTPPPPPGTGDPRTAQEYYNLLSGFWGDGTPFSRGGNGYSLEAGAEIIKYAFPDAPADNSAGTWSMAGEMLGTGDRRTIQASGPFTLQKDATNELIVGVVWVGDIENHPQPDLGKLLFADDLAQSLFDNCFKITDGPDAPDIDWLELDREVVGILTNDTLFVNNNNRFEEYEEPDLAAPTGTIDSTYVFEGYQVFQVRGPNDKFNDPENARLVFQVDVKNGISEIFNWTTLSELPGSVEDEIWVPEKQVTGDDTGIRHTFNLTEDAFSNSELINHKKYYYEVIAYAYNNYEDFDPTSVRGQRKAYLEGRRINSYTIIPRPITFENLNSSYGDGASVTRLDGVGNGGTFLDLTQASRDAAFAGTTEGRITYVANRAPVDVRVYNPFNVQNGTYQLTILDGSFGTNGEMANWELTDNGTGEVTRSESTIEVLNEQILPKYGFTVSIVDAPDSGDLADDTNGALGIEIDYIDPSKPQWAASVPVGVSPIDYIKADGRDPSKAYSRTGNELFVPYTLTDESLSAPSAPFFISAVLSPTWDPILPQLNDQVAAENPLQALNNVDVVFTSDKTKWSRCVVVETANRFYYTPLGPENVAPEGENTKNFMLRQSPSVSKEADASGLPMEDNEVDGEGNRVIGKGWFPGYAIDVETGKRLNIFFGENSIYDLSVPPVAEMAAEGLFTTPPTGRDMMWNPTNEGVLLNGGIPANMLPFYGGGQHYIYVTREEYDGCEKIHAGLTLPANAFDFVSRIETLQKITWTSFPLITENVSLTSYGEGLIPNDAIVKLRVSNPYQVAVGTGANEGYPTYEIVLGDVASTDLAEGVELDSALNQINVVPNPYYGFSDYEATTFSNTIKVTNLPAKATITIYTLDGKFVRQYNRDEIGSTPSGNNRALSTNQITPDLEWDLNNSRGVPVASGVYLIHVDAPGLGERVIKWFGVARQFDPSGL